MLGIVFLYYLLKQIVLVKVRVYRFVSVLWYLLFSFFEVGIIVSYLVYLVFIWVLRILILVYMLYVKFFNYWYFFLGF